MAIYDISVSISEKMPVWAGDPPVKLSQPAHLDRGDVYTLTRIDTSVHVGTHLDAPAHFVHGGGHVEGLDLNRLIGPALLVDAGEADALTADVLAGLAIPPGTERLLVRTRNSRLWAGGETSFREDFVAVAPDGARWLVAQGIKLIGVDYLSVAPFDDPVPTHQILLSAGVIPVEGLDLSAVAPGFYQFICLPIKIAGAEGAPCRAVLISS